MGKLPTTDKDSSNKLGKIQNSSPNNHKVKNIKNLTTVNPNVASSSVTDTYQSPFFMKSGHNGIKQHKITTAGIAKDQK